MSSDKPHSQQYTAEAANVTTGADVTSAGFDTTLLDFEDIGGFFDLLSHSDFSLAVTREYEHFLLTIDASAAGPSQSAFPLPHPSGLWFDKQHSTLTVASTRTPNILIWFTPFDRDKQNFDIVPADYVPPSGQTLFLPRQARYLPGTLYIHDLVKMGGDFYATITGHNFIAKLSLENGWERVWWPKILDGMGANAFNQNYFQLNSIAANGTPDRSFYTGFCDITTGGKPWKEGFGPDRKGVVFAGESREALYRGLTCPHSARLHDGKLWVCNSGYGEIGYIDDHASLDVGKTRFVPVARAPGFTRGLAFSGDVMFVGLSKVIQKYEPYAPGLKPDDTRCGVWAFRASTGEFLASLSWPKGYQLYDVQILPGIKNPSMPLAKREPDGINPMLRFLG